MKVIQFPLSKITICFVIGILVAHYFHLGINWFFPFFTILLFIAVLYLYYKKSKVLFGISVLFLSFLLGIITLLSHQETNNPKHYLHQLKTAQTEFSAQVILTEKLKNTTNNNRYVAQMVTLNNQESVGKIIVNIAKDSLIQDFEIGNQLLLQGSFYKNQKASNPNQFDYGKYLETKQIYAQIYTRNDRLKILKTHKTIWYYTSKWRNTIAKNLEKSGFSKQELNVAMALILGQQQDISPEIIHDYQYAGAIHILSVSGLHIASLLMVLNALLRFFPNTKKWRVFKLVFLLSFLWLFGILAGLAPAVLRSVTMYSFVTIGLHLRKTVNFYHTLLVSILLILLIEPSFIFDIGFQLSYLALFFIVWLQPIFEKIYTPKNKFDQTLWEILTVSFAAQIGTLPISIYYFHQFPTLFFITNLVVLPFLGIIMGYGVFVMLLAAFNVTWVWTSKLLEFFIFLMNKVISWVASFENFVLKDISLSAPMMWLLYVIIIVFFITIQKPTFKKIVFLLCGVIGLQFLFIHQKYQTQKTDEFIVFNKKRNTIITVRNGDNITLYGNDSIAKNHKNDLSLNAYVVANFCKLKSTQSPRNFFYFKDKKIMVIDSSGVYLENIQPDIVLLINSPKINLDRFLLAIKPQQIVADGSNFTTYRTLWEATCRKQKIPFHDTTEKGFYKF